MFSQLERELSSREATVITGMRRVGKTTAMLHLYNLVSSKNKALFDLENPLHRKVFEEENYDAVWNNLKSFAVHSKEKAYLFIDEVQNLPGISRVVKYLYDHYDVKFVLTGSSSYYLRNLFPESLAGRKVIYEMFPLTFEEFLVFRGIQRPKVMSFAQMVRDKNLVTHERLLPFYREYLEYGGFPSVVLEQNPERKRVLLTEIFTSYFEKDAKNLADFTDMARLRDLILLLTARIASRLEIHKLALELGVSRQTIYNYLAFLNDTYFITMLPRYSKSVDRQAAGSAKLFLCDCGMANVLGRISEGQLLEQGVFQTLRPQHALNYYAKEQGQEIDFILDSHTALEVKTSSSRQDIVTLEKRAETLNLHERYIVSYTFSKDEQVIAVTEL